MTDREQFEAWLKDDYYDGCDDGGGFDEERRCYNHLGAHMAWLSWQASRADLEKENKRLKLIARALLAAIKAVGPDGARTLGKMLASADADIIAAIGVIQNKD